MIIARFAGAPQLTLYLHGGLALGRDRHISVRFNSALPVYQKNLLEHHSQVSAADIYI